MRALMIRWRPLALLGLCLLGLMLRLYGLNWDQGNNFHPDERQILFVVTSLRWPTSWAQFFDPTKSPLNPHFFAYGSFPLYLLAFLGSLLKYNFLSPDILPRLTLVGRVLSALFDSGTILLTGLLALQLLKGDQPERPYAWSVALLAAALVVFTPLELQLSHFYAVDTMLLFFVMLTLFAAVVLVHTTHPLRWGIIAGVAYGLALGTKFSAAPLVVPILVAITLRYYSRRDLFDSCSALFLAGCFTLLIFLVTNPYALLDFANFRKDLTAQGNMAQGMLDFPYVRQFTGTVPYLYELQNIVLWGLGLMLGCAACLGLLWFIIFRRKFGPWLVVISWLLLYSAITGSFYVKFMRYMLPIYPLLTLIAATALIRLLHAKWSFEQPSWQRLRPFTPFLGIAALVLVLGGTIFQGLALLNVYSLPNTRIQASRWMYANLRPGSVLTYEQWDDPLPVAVDGYQASQFVQASYPTGNGTIATGLDLYGDDTIQKAHQLASLLPTLNAITMATDRLDKSIPRLPARYPLTIHYYQLLFNGQLGFHLALQVENHPHLLGLTLDDSGADESYSVFDHPTARIFVRDNPYPYTTDQLFRKLLDGVHLPFPGLALQHHQLTTPLTISYQRTEPPPSFRSPVLFSATTAPFLLLTLFFIVLSRFTALLPIWTGTLMSLFPRHRPPILAKECVCGDVYDRHEKAISRIR